MDAEKERARLIPPSGFVAAMAAETCFERTLLDRDGVQVIHHRNAPGSYAVAGLQSHGVAVQCSGAGRHAAILDGRNHAGHAGCGMSWLKPAGTAIAWHWDDPAEVINIWISPRVWRETVAAAVGRDGARAEFRGRFIADDPLVRQVAFTLRDEAGRGRPYGRLLTDGLLTALVAHLANEAGTWAPAGPPRGGLSSWHLRRVLEYIDARLGDDIPLAELAGLAGLSHRHFCTAFRRSVGLPPHRYLVERRIERAKALLPDPRLSVTAAAFAAGFGSSAHFATMFRKATGVSPSRWRASAR